MAPLNYINYVNVVASCIVALHTAEVDLGPEYEFFQKFSIAALPERYEEGTMTPTQPFFFIFNIVSLFLVLFSIVQLLPAYRSSPMVQGGVEYWFIAAALAQVIGYAIASDERDNTARTFFSTLFFAVMGVFTWMILDKQVKVKSDGSAEEYWMLRVPFSLLAGWSMCLTIMSANVLVRDAEPGFNFGSFMKVVIVLISLAAYAAIPIKLLAFNGSEPNYIIPLVISAVTLGIALNTDEAAEVTFTAVFLLLFIYLISIGSAVYTAYLVYTNEFKQDGSEALIESDPVEPLSDTVYVGGAMQQSDVEAPAKSGSEEVQSKPDLVDGGAAVVSKPEAESVSTKVNQSAVTTENEAPVTEETSAAPKYTKQPRPRRTPLNLYNILNFLASYIMALYTADIDIDLNPEYEFFSKFNLWVFAERYQAGAMTPAEPFFFIFIAVALFCAVFGVVQLLPAFRAHPMVQGVKYWFFVAVVAQVLAYIAGAAEEDSLLEKCLSTFFFLVMAVSVYMILEQQSDSLSDGSATEYWLLRFPFSLYGGWSIVIVLMSASTIFVDFDEEFGFNAVMHMVVLGIALAIYGGVSMKLLLGKETNFVVPLVLAVASFGIALDPIENKSDQWASILFLLMGFLIAFLTFLVYSSTESYETEPPKETDRGSYVGAKVPSSTSNAGTMV